MRDLIDIIKIVTPESLAQINLFTPKVKTRTKLNQLYNKIRLGEIQTNEDAIDVLYKKDKQGKQKLIRLKYALKSKLLNNILLLRINKSKFPRKAIFFDSSRILIIAKFLMLSNSRKLSVRLLEQLLPSALKQEFILQALEASTLLRQYYTIYNNQSEKIQYHSDLIYNLLEALRIETEANNYYYELLGHFSDKRVDYGAVNQLAQKYRTKLSVFSIDQMTADSLFKVKMIAIIECASRFDFEEAKSICTHSIELLNKKSYKHQSAIFTIYLQWMRACLQLGHLEEAQRLIPQLNEYVTPGAYNWLLSIKVQIQFAIRSKNYENIPNLYLELAKYQDNFRRNQRIQEELNMLALAIHVLIKSKLLVWDKSIFALDKIEDLKHSFKEFGKQKLEMNIPIVIYPLFLMLLDKNYTAIIDKIDTLERYDMRYLKACNSPRHHYFLMLILGLAKKDFNLSLISPSYISKLKHPQNDFIDLDAELIPYEDLWDCIVSSL